MPALCFVSLLSASIFEDLDSGAEFGDDAPYLENDGVILFEAESLPHDPAHWALETAIDGFSGTGYLVGKTNTFNVGGLGKISYPIQVSVSGVYQLNWKGRITKGDLRGEHNDAFARILDAEGNPLSSANSENELVRNTQWYKVFMNRLGQWSYDSKNVDNVGISIAWELEAGKAYTFEISVRSEGFGLDRIVLWNRAVHNFADTSSGRVANVAPMEALAQSRQAVEVDKDNDGMLDSYEELYGGLALMPDIDPDGDGMVTGFESVVGTDPFVANAPGFLEIVERDDAVYVKYEYAFLDEAVDFYELVPEHSSDLINWDADGIFLQQQLESDGEEEGLSRVVALLEKEAFEDGGLLRLKVKRRLD